MHGRRFDPLSILVNDKMQTSDNQPDSAHYPNKVQIRTSCDEIASLLRHNGGAYRRCRAHRYATSHNSAYATFLDLKPSVLSLETIASGAAVI